MAIEVVMDSWRMCQLGEQSPFPLAPHLPLLGEQRPLVACAGQLHADGVSDSCPTAVEEALLGCCRHGRPQVLLCYGRATLEGERAGGYLSL